MLEERSLCFAVGFWHYIIMATIAETTAISAAFHNFLKRTEVDIYMTKWSGPKWSRTELAEPSIIFIKTCKRTFSSTKTVKSTCAISTVAVAKLLVSSYVHESAHQNVRPWPPVLATYVSDSALSAVYFLSRPVIAITANVTEYTPLVTDFKLKLQHQCPLLLFCQCTDRCVSHSQSDNSVVIDRMWSVGMHDSAWFIVCGISTTISRHLTWLK